MKRYLIFSYAHYYAFGGWSDFKSAHETFMEADAESIKIHTPHADDPNGITTEIVDTDTMQVVWTLVCDLKPGHYYYDGQLVILNKPNP